MENRRGNANVALALCEEGREPRALVVEPWQQPRDAARIAIKLPLFRNCATVHP